ncbi:hypothetical protein JQ616_05835 [Bradyrhizobium tropiciagri]|uniref:DEAD/DEAH box helicase family protein n=1 Tax=Bradyrhizobium tropiciagri TaxID=312253 RepID=UPI001BAD5080|nr:DEAD/DEAH box helicase family protein [Bradyrhizobium tropiciagri]MBR0894463.1 hypothetical protein [Bradyrhizobium tropiciagri]
MAVNVEELREIAAQRDRYLGQLNRLKKLGKQTTCVEAAVSSACETLNAGTTSFVIYGEPQSGKTEMMICLTAKLLDDGNRVIIHLLNDSVQLLQQNLDRFQRSNLSPAARNFSDVIDPDYSFASGFHVVFCKKNASDLAKLNQKLERVREKVVIDDEADFATPNALINKGDVTRIGTETSDQQARNDDVIKRIISDLRLSPRLSPRHEAVLAHYIEDMRLSVAEAARVLKPGGKAIYVVGENTVRGTFIPNAKIVSAVAERAGLSSETRRTRVLPANRRYLPPPSTRNGQESLDGRMRREVILSFTKPD